MTDFLSWWADHWPLVPFLIPVFAASLDYLWRRWKRRMFQNPFYPLIEWAKRRREP